MVKSRKFHQDTQVHIQCTCIHKYTCILAYTVHVYIHVYFDLQCRCIHKHTCILCISLTEYMRIHQIHVCLVNMFKLFYIWYMYIQVEYAADIKLFCLLARLDICAIHQICLVNMFKLFYIWYIQVEYAADMKLFIYSFFFNDVSTDLSLRYFRRAPHPWCPWSRPSAPSVISKMPSCLFRKFKKKLILKLPLSC